MWEQFDTLTWAILGAVFCCAVTIKLLRGVRYGRDHRNQIIGWGVRIAFLLGAAIINMVMFAIAFKIGNGLAPESITNADQLAPALGTAVTIGWLLLLIARPLIQWMFQWLISFLASFFTTIDKELKKP